MRHQIDKLACCGLSTASIPKVPAANRCSIVLKNEVDRSIANGPPMFGQSSGPEIPGIWTNCAVSTPGRIV